MGDYTAALVIGSIRKESFNKKLGGALVKLAPKTLRFETVPIDDLPPYNQDRDGDFPPEAKRLKERIAGCDAVPAAGSVPDESVTCLIEISPVRRSSEDPPGTTTSSQSPWRPTTSSSTSCLTTVMTLPKPGRQRVAPSVTTRTKACANAAAGTRQNVRTAAMRRRRGMADLNG